MKDYHQRPYTDQLLKHPFVRDQPTERQVNQMYKYKLIIVVSYGWNSINHVILGENSVEGPPGSYEEAQSCQRTRGERVPVQW